MVVTLSENLKFARCAKPICYKGGEADLKSVLHSDGVSKSVPLPEESSLYSA